MEKETEEDREKLGVMMSRIGQELETWEINQLAKLRQITRSRYDYLTLQDENSHDEIERKAARKASVEIENISSKSPDGSTKRHLHQRVAEHAHRSTRTNKPLLSDPNSNIHHHSRTCGCTRPDRHWFLVNDSIIKTDRLMTITRISEKSPLLQLYDDEDAQKAVFELFLALQELQLMVEELRTASNKAGLEINLSKTKVMFNRNVEIQPIMTENVALDQVDRYTYLGQLISIHRDWEPEHPFIQPVLDINYKLVKEQMYVVIVFPFNKTGCLKDLIYNVSNSNISIITEPIEKLLFEIDPYLPTNQTKCQDTFAGKNNTSSAKPLEVAQIRTYGRQILEAILFLRDYREFPPIGEHLHSGNVIIQDGHLIFKPYISGRASLTGHPERVGSLHFFSKQRHTKVATIKDFRPTTLNLNIKFVPVAHSISSIYRTTLTLLHAFGVCIFLV
ncbi:Slowpoke-binding protein [Nymphon striatum]|nr:Slowpoke-binding protein [Nymphon striatum]